MRIAVVILAGGEGSRMGGGKPFRLLGDRPLIDRALEMARGWSDDVAISARNQDLDRAAEVLPDLEGQGPIAGLASALRFARARDLGVVLTIPCDTPFLPADLPHRLTSLLGGESHAAIPESGGRLHPTAGLWATDAADALPAYLATGRGSLMGLAETIGYATAEWPIEPFDPFFNVNTPEDLAQAEALLKNR